MKLNKWLLAGMMAGALLAAGCTDDDDNKNGNSENGSGSVLNVVDTPNWIGTACECIGDGCEAMDVPLPAPTGNAMIKGCTEVSAADVPGGQKVCLRTIDEKYKTTAPSTYFPQGYCAISAVGCEPLEDGADGLCRMAAYGDAAAMTKCPKGSTLIESVFEYKIMGKNTRITNKTCARSCNTDDDCNKDGEMTCMQKGSAKFCYHQKNFDGTTNEYTATGF